MARHWLPVQGFDGNLADHVFGIHFGRFEARSQSEDAEEDSENPQSAPNEATNTPSKRRAAAQKFSPRKKNQVASNAVIRDGEPAMAMTKEGEELTVKLDPSVTTTIPQVSCAPDTPESGMTMKEETTPTRIIKPDPEQSAIIPTAKTMNKEQKKKNLTASVATEGNSRPPTKINKAKTGSLPIPISWAEAGVADRMLVTSRDNGENWAKIRKEWKEMTGLDTAASTLPVRYSRLKAIMTTLEDGDAARLIQAKDQVEIRLQTEKYAMIAETLERLGGKRYSNAFIRKEVKKLERTGVAGTASATGARGADQGDATAAIKGEKSEEGF